jgi:hypothetical protein
MEFRAALALLIVLCCPRVLLPQTLEVGFVGLTSSKAQINGSLGLGFRVATAPWTINERWRLGAVYRLEGQRKNPVHFAGRDRLITTKSNWLIGPTFRNTIVTNTSNNMVRDRLSVSVEALIGKTGIEAARTCTNRTDPDAPFFIDVRMPEADKFAQDLPASQDGDPLCGRDNPSSNSGKLAGALVLGPEFYVSDILRLDFRGGAQITRHRTISKWGSRFEIGVTFLWNRK